MVGKFYRALVCGVAASFVLMAHAAADDLQSCLQASVDAAIAACSSAIASKTYSGTDLGRLYKKRAAVYDKKEQFDRCIVDYNEVLRIIPTDVNALINRASCYRSAGNYDRAITDYDQAISMPLSAYGKMTANGGRGVANFSMAKFRDSAIDFARSLQAKPDYAYAVLWLYLADVRSGGRSARVDLETNAARIKQTEWPYPVIELFLGSASPDVVLTAASKPDDRCEAQFFIGEWQLMHNSRVDAVKALRSAAEICPKGFWEYTGAITELKRLTKD